MDNEEKYLLYKKKLKKYSIAMLIISLMTAAVHFFITFNYMKNCIHKIISGNDQALKSVNWVSEYIFMSKIAAVSSIILTVLLLFAAIISILIFRNTVCEKYVEILKLIYFGATVYIIIIAVFAVAIAIFLTLCCAMLFLVMDKLFAIFSNVFFVLVFGSVGGFFWTLISIDMRSVLKNLMFYKVC